MAPIEPSILKSTKKVLNIDADYAAFDLDIILHINSVFSDLHQIGLGPDIGFEISDDAQNWASFINNDKLLNSVKSYMFLRVRLLFDPPGNSFAIDSMQKQIDKLEWRLNVASEEKRKSNA